MSAGSGLLTAASKELVDVEGPLILRARLVEAVAVLHQGGEMMCTNAAREKRRSKPLWGGNKAIDAKRYKRS